MKRIFVIENLCNGCRLCETFCSSLKEGVFNGETARIKVINLPDEGKDIPLVDCNGKCIRPLSPGAGPTCVAFCPTGALIYTKQAEAVLMRRDYEAARKKHALFKVLAPWKWPFPWKRPGAQKATSQEELPYEN